tara:strand:+ start:7226 stop:7825 length:600 start_codon:yes stop_codon:yes gene_type:complete
MSCGPAEKMRAMADEIDALNKKAEDAVNAAIGDKLGALQQEAQDKINGIMAKVEGMIPSIGFPKPSTNSISDLENIAKLIMLGKLAEPQVEAAIKQFKSAWGGDIDIDNLADRLRKGSLAIDQICKAIPNLETDGVQVTVKGTPTSFPEVDAVALLKGGDLPEYKKPKLQYDITKRTKEATDSFLKVKMPRIKIGPGHL